MSEFKGYKVIRDTELKELNSRALLLEHEKTKARVLKLENDDENKTFTIGFKTAQHDDTGVCHILEHSVLSGSRKYKTKEPFMEIIKNSLQTFVNAMTFMDKTIYPISSRNDKDFRNLMDVYLDAVFHPSIHIIPEILRQEGWHYEIENKDDDLSVVGVVLNEMRGAMSSDIAQVNDVMHRKLYKNSTYETNSGGDPHHIMDLDPETMQEYHKNHYHPTNSYIFLWGNCDTKKELEHLSEYLDEFDYMELKDEMIPIKPLKETIVETGYYNGEDKPNNDFFVVSYLGGDGTSNLDAITNDLLQKLLIYEEGAAIKDRIISEGLGTDVTSTYSVGETLNFSVIVKETSEDKKERILEIIDEELQKIADGDIDRKEYDALMHQVKYDTKTYGDTTFIGGYAYIMAMDAWLYGKDPIDYLSFDGVIEKLEKDPNILSNYVKKYMRGPRLELMVKADPNYTQKKDDELKERLRKYKENLSDEEVEKLIEETKSLHEFQLREDTPEEKATIPKLSLDDLNKKLPKIELVSDKNLHWSKGFTLDVANVVSFTTLPLMEKEKLQKINIVNDLITKLETERFTIKELNTEINRLSYDFSSDFGSTTLYNKDQGMLLFSKTISADTKDFLDAYKLLDEVHLTTSFKDAKKIKEILQSRISREKLSAVMSGVKITAHEATKDMNEIWGLTEAIEGVSNIKFMKKLVEIPDEELVKTLEEAYEEFKEIWKKDAVYHVTGEEKERDAVLNTLKELDLYKDEPEKIKHELKFKKGKSHAITAITDVNYCVDAAPIKKVKGSYKVVSNLLQNFYLHNNIRAKGGAYGDGITLNSGLCTMYSYRDPNLTSTQQIFESVPTWLRGQNPSKEEIESLIIGSYNSFDPHLTMKQRGYRNFMFYLTEKTYEDLNRELNEALNTSKEDIDEFANTIEEIMKDKGRAVFTNEKTYQKHQDLFDERVEL